MLTVTARFPIYRKDEDVGEWALCWYWISTFGWRSELAYFIFIINVTGISTCCVWTLREPNGESRQDGGCVVCDVMGESGSQVVPQPPMLSYTQFLRVCLYMTTPDLSLWHMSEIAPLHLWCISRGPGPHTHTHTNTLRDWRKQGKSTWLLLVTHTNTHRLHPHKEDDKLHVSQHVYIPPCSKRLPQAPTRPCVHGTHLNTLIK